MSLDVMDTLEWIRRMPMPRRIDAILKRERALELLSKRAEGVIGGLGRRHGQQNKVIQVNAITEVLNSQLATGRWQCVTSGGCLAGLRSEPTDQCVKHTQMVQIH